MIYCKGSLNVNEKENQPMECKVCGCPIDQSIEGELICSKDWARGQMSSKERATEDEIEHALTHCSDCDKKLKTAKEKQDMRCTACQKELGQEFDFTSELEPANWTETIGLHTPTLEAQLSDERIKLELRFANGHIETLQRSDIEALTRFLNDYAQVASLIVF